MEIGRSSSRLGRKKKKITPIFRKNKKEDLVSYRLVSFTLIIGKAMEKILESISKDMKDKKVIRSSQHRFTKRKSCLTNLVAFYTDN